MALDDDATVVPAVGEYWFHPAVDSPPPADFEDPAADDYEDLGHTSLEDPFAIASEGGEQTVLGTWRNKALRSVLSPRVESINFILQQWDGDNYQLYFGANTALDPVSGFWMTPSNPVETEGTLFLLIRDGDEALPLWFPRVSIFRNDDIEADPEAFMGMPVRATVLGRSGEQGLYGIQPKAALAGS